MSGRNIINPSAIAKMDKGMASSKHQRHSSTGRIRKNFMRKLGITDAASSSSKKISGEESTSAAKKSLLGSSPKITVEPLNDHDDFVPQDVGFWNFLKSKSEPWLMNSGSGSLKAEVSSLISTSTRSSSESSGTEKRLTFHEEVTVCPIPRRDQYSYRIRQHLWPSMNEISQKAAKNTLEFASEGWDWRKSLDKDEMYFDVSTGEYIHPIHIIVEQQQGAQLLTEEESKMQ